MTSEKPSAKRCTRCKEYKPKDTSNFPRHNKTKDGFDSWCRVCRATYRSEINRGKFRGQLSDEKVKSLKKQSACDICGKPEYGGSRHNKHIKKVYNLVMDHDHQSGKFRGMLCSLCNRGLGNFKDDVAILERAIQYLKINETK